MKERKIEYEILKAILIISIVVGHTLATSLINVFWYHVPGFFMLTGYFSKSSILDGKYLNINSVLINRLRRYVLPYFSYSIVLYILFQQEPVIKNLVRVLLGGGWNVGLYSYPFWFINALFVTTIAFDLILCTYSQITFRSPAKVTESPDSLIIWFMPGYPVSITVQILCTFTPFLSGTSMAVSSSTDASRLYR